MIDFANSFIYNAASPITMEVFGGISWSDIVAGATCIAPSGFDISPNPISTGIVDSDASPSFGWDIPFSCASVNQVDVDAVGNKVLKYDLFWNSQFQDGYNTPMYQLDQVKISSTINPYQEDAAAVTITKDTAINDIDNKVDIAAGLELKVNSFSFESGTLIDETALNPTPISASTAITYTAATTAKFGDYMELEIAEVASSGLLAQFSVSITKCWASTVAKAATFSGTAGDPYYADTSNPGSNEEFIFFDNFCPLYPSWVGPGATDGTGYLKEIWDHTSDLHKVHFRQFGFQSADANYYPGQTGNEIYYHCFVKICEKGNTATCSQTSLDGVTATDCSYNAVYAVPTRRRRSTDEGVEAADIVANVTLAPVEDCEEKENCFLYGRAAEARDDENVDDSNSAATITTALAAATLAFLI